MTYVPTPTYAQAADDFISTGGFYGPCAVPGAPAAFTLRHVQVAALAALNGTFIAQPVPSLGTWPGWEDGLLRISAHLALGQ